MAQRVIEIPGVGNVEFPDSMSEAEISTAAAKLYNERQAPAAPPDFRTTNVPIRYGLGVPETAQTLADVGIGAVKGAAQTATNLGRLVHKIPGVSNFLFSQPGLAETAFAEADQALKPTNRAQQVGKIGEQVAEVVVPGSKIAAAGEQLATRLAPTLVPAVGKTAARVLPRAAVEATGGAALSAAQGGNPLIGAAGGAVAPVIGTMVEGLPGRLKEKAAEKVVQALGPTKERYKAIATRLAPKILQRGLGGSRASLQTQAAETLGRVGDELDTALTQYGQQAVTTTQPVLDALETAKDAFRTTTPTGAVVEFEPRSIRQLNSLQEVIRGLGPQPTVEQLVAVRRAWDRVVDQAGGFAHRATGAIGVPLKDISEAWAKREATGAIRQLLKTEVPDLGAINKEWSFWKDLNDVLTQTMQRTQPQGPGVGQMLARGAGGVAGAALGAGGGPLTGAGATLGAAQLAAMAQKAMTSPQWRLVDARLRNRLADALVNNNAGELAVVLSRINAVEGSKIGQ
jgi:hypothetical protein